MSAFQLWTVVALIASLGTGMQPVVRLWVGFGLLMISKSDFRFCGIPAFSLSRIHAVQTNPSPLPFTKGEGTFGGTVSGSTTRDPRQVRSSSPLPARSGDQGEGRFRLHTYG